MYILINEQRIEITSKTVQRFKNDGRLLLTVIIPKENISAGELDSLCEEIEDNSPEIKVYDNDEIVQTLTGFKMSPIFALSKDRTSWELSIENSSELEYQYGLLKDRADALENSNKEQALVIASQGETISEQSERIGNQDILISEQEEKITAQSEEITLLNDTILEILMG